MNSKTESEKMIEQSELNGALKLRNAMVVGLKNTPDESLTRESLLDLINESYKKIGI